MHLEIFSHKKDFSKATVNFIKDVCKKNDKKIIHIALSGGSTPEPIYRALAKEKLPWKNLKFYIVDERYVPFTNKNSNFRMINTALFKKISLKNFPHFHYFDTSLPIKKSLQKYQKELPKKFDLIILGIGSDFHTASIFPNSKITGDVAHTKTSKFPIKDRLTITFKKILPSKNILVLLNGPDKKPIVEKLKKTSPKNLTAQNYQKFPGLKLLQNKNLHIFYCS